jgi:hypothetical protein
MRTSKRRWTWAARLAALVVAVVIPACGTGATPGKSKSGSLLWVSQAGSASQSGSNQPVQWIDPNTGLGAGPIGVIQIISSVDDATYARYNVSTKPPPFNQFVAYIYALEHPLSTDTSSTTITSIESELLGYLNGYRDMVMGNHVNANQVVANGGVVLPSFNGGTKSARAHCKHYAYFHGGQPMPAELGWDPHPYTPPANLFPGAPWILQNGISAATPHPRENAEGDHVIFTILGSPADQTNNPGMLTPLRAGMQPYNRLANRGRFGKIGITCSPVIGEFSYSGVQWDDPIKVRDQILNDDPGLVVDFYPPPLYPVWSHICVGHWRGGAQTYYYDVLFVKNPNPAD